jgi:hypothetical protein
MSKVLIENIKRRMEQSSTPVKESELWLAADIVSLCMTEAERWTRRADDAVRIPDMLDDVVVALKRAAEAAREE